MLNELGLEYEMVPINVAIGETKGHKLKALNPAAKVPVMVDGKTVITESSAIQLYLAEKHPKAGLIPDSIEERGQMYRWIFFLVTEIEQPLWRIARHTVLYPKDKRLPQDIEIAKQECKEMVAVLENHMDKRQYIVGKRLSVADFNAAYVMDWANENKLLEDAPKLRKYLRWMYSRPTAPPRIASALALLKSLPSNASGSKSRQHDRTHRRVDP